MEGSIFGSALELLEAIFGHSAGSPVFKVALGVSVAAWVITARLFMAMFSTSRGILAAFLACVISLPAGLFGYVAMERYALPRVQADWADPVLPLLGLFGLILLSILLVTKWILKVSAGGTVFIYIVATMVAVCANIGVQITTGLMDAGTGQVEQREQRIREKLDSIH
jgi:hypothetical protein